MGTLSTILRRQLVSLSGAAFAEFMLPCGPAIPTMIFSRRRRDHAVGDKQLHGAMENDVAVCQPVSLPGASSYRRGIDDPSGERMNAVDALHAAPGDVRDAALALLDQVSAPLTERQLAAALRAQGVRRMEARKVARALKTLAIIAIVPRA
jgi:hypothetical protein